MFHDLKKLIPKPELYTPSTSSFWDDEHISKGMLEAHLNPVWDAASRNHEFIDKSVKWISEIAPPSQYKQLLDLGCGPGLYAERFSNAGYSVTGIDFSKRSIEYAKEQSSSNKSNIAYIYQNYLEIDYIEMFDVVTLIYCDYSVLSITDRQNLLKKIYQSLKHNGKFIFDVFTPVMRKNEHCSWKYCENGGFFNAEPHIHMEALYQYDNDDRTELNQNIIITDKEMYCYNIWNHYLNKANLTSEIQAVGFTQFELYGDVAGKIFSNNGEMICAVIAK